MTRRRRRPPPRRPRTTEPTLLLLDEPSLGLAPVRVDECTTPSSASRPPASACCWWSRTWSALAIAGRAYLLGEGRVVASGPAAELRDRADVRRSAIGL